jgi:hypothetical protein
MLITPRRARRTGDARTRGLPLEFARVQERAHILLHLEGLLARWPVGFTAAARERKLTQRSFVRWALPKWLAEPVGQLPEGHARSRANSGSQALRQRLQALRRQGAEGRTARAELLWQAACR